MTVNKERLKLGIEALRSGEYIQAQNALAPMVRGSEGDYQAYCCLGVLCEVAIKNGLEGVRRVDGIFEVGYQPTGEYEGAVESAIMPREVADWYGFKDGNPEVVEGDGNWEEVTSLNDNAGWTFNQIADAFEQTYVNVEDQ